MPDSAAEQGRIRGIEGTRGRFVCLLVGETNELVVKVVGHFMENHLVA